MTKYVSRQICSIIQYSNWLTSKGYMNVHHFVDDSRYHHILFKRFGNFLSWHSPFVPIRRWWNYAIVNFSYGSCNICKMMSAVGGKDNPNTGSNDIFSHCRWCFGHNILLQFRHDIKVTMMVIVLTNTCCRVLLATQYLHVLLLMN